MRVIPFPGRRLSAQDEAVLAQLEAALDGDGTGPEAEYWRELRSEVRSLADPIDPAFAQALEQRVRVPATRRRRARMPGQPRPRRLHGVREIQLGGRGATALAIAAACIAVLVAAIAAGALSGGGSSPRPVAGPERGPSTATHGPRVENAGTAAEVERGGTKGPAQGVSGASASSAVNGPAEPTTAGTPLEAGGRLQQLGASISLSATGAEGVQQVAGRVGHATVAAGGFVESSRVETRQGSAGEALMTLSLPSAKLAAVLAELERIAPVRAETQSLQDITSEYAAAGARLSSARAERSALLRALAKATTAAAIESLHARIAQANSNIASAEHQRASISHRASRSHVEVTVLGGAHHAGSGLTVANGLSDAGNVLTAALAVLIVAVAVLVPLALLLGALFLGTRFWRRQQRERALGSS